jgi:hypothetical protein
MSRQTQFLMIAEFTNRLKDLAAISIASMCKKRQIFFDIYYAIGDPSTFDYDRKKHVHQGQAGGLFSAHGSTLIGGRHQQALSRSLAQYETTVVRLDNVHVMETLLRAGAERVIEGHANLTSLLKECASVLEVDFPKVVLAVQTEGLPTGLTYGAAQYVFPEALYRDAWAFPLELPAAEIQQLADHGVQEVWTIGTSDADTSAWLQAGLSVRSSDVLKADDNYLEFTFRIAERWQNHARGFDLCEPVLASYWLPFSIHHDRFAVCGETMVEAAEKVVPLVQHVRDNVVYGRYAGGPICGARDDEELFPLFRNDIAFQVIEPNRPVLKALSYQPRPLPQPAASPFDLEPPDEQLQEWAKKGFILTSLVFHSGELSHDDANYYLMEAAGLHEVRIGLPMQTPRYTFDPDCVEPMHIPIEQGGVLGLCEPLLHSSGLGIHAEGIGTPEVVAGMMKAARDDITRWAGERFAPRGVYCYLDANPPDWKTHPLSLWKAIQQAGFEYVISSVANGPSQVLYRDGDFVVLNQNTYNMYPYSPFIRANGVEQLAEIERFYTRESRPGYILAVLDTPIFAYSSYLIKGKSRPMEFLPLVYKDARIGDFFEYVRSRGATHKIISATPHTIARYARLLHDMSLL